MTQNSNVTITISPATPADFLGIRDVFYKGWLATYPNEEIGVTVDDIEEWHTNRYDEENIKKYQEIISYPPEGLTVLVAKDADVVTGVCRVVLSPDFNQLRALYVLPDYHSQGIGTVLWQYAQAYLDPTTYTRVEVATYNTRAIRFYKKLGFVDTGECIRNPKFTMKSGTIIPELVMRRESSQNISIDY